MKYLIFLTFLSLPSFASEINECGQTFESWANDEEYCFNRIGGVTIESKFNSRDEVVEIIHEDLSDEQFENQWELAE